MKKYIYSQQDYNKLLRVEEATPKCGDICNRCGECLVRYGEAKCLDGFHEDHLWVEYEQEKNHAEPN